MGVVYCTTNGFNELQAYLPQSVIDTSCVWRIGVLPFAFERSSPVPLHCARPLGCALSQRPYEPAVRGDELSYCHTLQGTVARSSATKNHQKPRERRHRGKLTPTVKALMVDKLKEEEEEEQRSGRFLRRSHKEEEGEGEEGGRRRSRILSLEGRDRTGRSCR
ncbi:hypothetical protein AGOR_G00087530 [Albula goreensis]|uniref:Uncharacterized protein n=1 Tax=Albula goreensis TaxID=1534307 RepID=A0A8T3DMS5_9TELE|nr:hypothetical protein AGOR_G00087530 [Albula goreensis]